MFYINTQTLEYPVTETFIRMQFPNTSFGIPFTPPGPYAIVHDSLRPELGNTTIERIVEIAPVKTQQGWVRAWAVVSKFSEYTDSEGVLHTVADQETEAIAKKAQEDAERSARQLADKVEQLWQAADKYTSSYISGVAIGLLTIGVMQQKPKALAISEWSSKIWEEYYKRKALVTLDSVDDLDFSSFGSMPYSVQELQAEVGLF